MNYEQAVKLLRYDACTGKLYLRMGPRSVYAWKELNSPHSMGYYQVMINGVKYLVHRLIWLLLTGDWPINFIDHIDGNGRNNKPENLRDVTQQDNLRNQRKSSRNTSGFTGVTWDKSVNKWKASVTVNKSYKHLGHFNTPEEAYKVRRAEEARLGYHVNHGES